MNDIGSMLQQMADRLLSEQCDREQLLAVEAGEWPVALWRHIESSGLALAAVPEQLGGAGVSMREAALIMRSAGHHALPLPLVESMLANWLHVRCGRRPSTDALTIAISDAREPVRVRRLRSGWTLSGAACDVPWARHVARIVAVARTDEETQYVVSVARNDCRILAGASVAAEPRDRVVFDGVVLDDDAVVACGDGDCADDLLQLGALSRCQQMVGAMQWILERTCRYAGERIQFGKSIGSFQAVQQLIAVMASHVSAATTAADAAVDAWVAQGCAEAPAYAKSRVGEAAGEVAAIAHQVHGAMGYSREYPLHFRTRRLWAWREEFGNERFWQLRLGRRLCARGGAALWSELTQ